MSKVCIQKNKKEDDSDGNKKDDKDTEPTMSLKQAKFDVFKFGIKGFSKEEQENAKIQHAIKLGAAVINFNRFSLIFI